MDLYILRHGKAGTSFSGKPDADRHLTRQGRDEIQQEAYWMLRNRCRFDLIATSPLERAVETAEIVAGVHRHSGRPAIWKELSPGMDFSDLMARIASCTGLSSLLIVGHEPSLSECIGRIITRGGGADIQLKKGGLARIRQFSPSPVSGSLSWLLSPRHMR
ncbi:MAG TPA: phosphohistidine phosphatase SixA [Methanoregulaceae archaeon]|nr:MAG: phosphohistidine phosphatase SixA [Methanolinea sp.]HON82058.1 phosphohistidine phosphatase SixA [Methanoregulaceae archaeon]HPD10982.1 phosphohistidine phosphatase SixA [Methanoregulaceae archaeon]HRT15887.1 phosphohistidine phosphatase SixA [Methanoregulaceae archaeon]HRU31353.1 phosphohistidine phosphatase SixA [Methanoregulaceae archaeon]